MTRWQGGIHSVCFGLIQGSTISIKLNLDLAIGLEGGNQTVSLKRVSPILEQIYSPSEDVKPCYNIYSILGKVYFPFLLYK